MVICNGPPLNYYMFPLGWAGKVNFTGLLRKHDVKTSQGNVMDMGQDHHFQKKKKKKNLESVILRLVAVGSELHPSGSKLETLCVSRWRREGHHTARARGLDHGRTCLCACVCVGGWRGWHTHALHLSQLTLRICLRGTSPPRPIHQPGPNTPCATVDMGLTTWHWQRWARPAAEWRLWQRERWIGLWSTFNLNYCKYFHLAQNWVHYEVHAAGQVTVIFQTEIVWSRLFANNLYPCSRSENKCDISPRDLVLTSEHCFRIK